MPVSTTSFQIEVTSQASPYLPVVPGLFSYGTDTPAGRGGEILYVTNRNDAGAGSLRQAAEAQGPRVILFEVSGVIELLSEITINDPYVTIAGQTAPSPGIMVRGAGITVNSTHDVLIQHLAIRVGDAATGPNVDDRDCLRIVGTTDRVVIDHCSLAWSTDENLSVWAFAPSTVISNITVSNCIIAEGLNNPPSKPLHTAKGLIVGHQLGSNQPTGIAIIKNLFAHQMERNPYTTSAVIANNLVYNWQWQAMDIRGDYQQVGTARASVVGNLYEAGLQSNRSRKPLILRELANDSEIYLADNSATYVPGVDQWADLVSSTGGTNLANVRVDTAPIWPPGFVADPVSTVRANLLAGAGTRPGDRDSSDQRIIDDVINGTGRLKGCVEDCAGVGNPVPGGWPALAENSRTLSLPSSPNSDSGNGYTNLEVWLHAFAADVQ